LDPIYHPNVRESGEQCCFWLIGDFGGWKPSSTMAELVTHVINTINNHLIPDHGDFQRSQEYEFKYSNFYEKALRQTLSYGRPRY
jgi:ubiquitin-protein ligase